MLEKDANVRSVERAIDILNCFTKERLALTLTEISKQVGLAPSTALRIVTTLVNNNFLAKNEETQKYCLGYNIAQLGLLCFYNMDLRDISKPYMYRLKDIYNESVSLYTTQGNYRVCIERIESTHPLRRVVNIGDNLPLTRGASGRLLLAYMEKEVIRYLLEDDPYTTEEAIVRVRQLGYAVSQGEREEGVTSIAAPIFNAQNKVIAALSISGPSIRFAEEEMPERINSVKECAEKVSLELGHKKEHSY